MYILSSSDAKPLYFFNLRKFHCTILKVSNYALIFLAPVTLHFIFYYRDSLYERYDHELIINGDRITFHPLMTHLSPVSNVILKQFISMLFS